VERSKSWGGSGANRLSKNNDGCRNCRKKKKSVKGQSGSSRETLSLVSIGVRRTGWLGDLERETILNRAEAELCETTAWKKEKSEKPPDNWETQAYALT